MSSKKKILVLGATGMLGNAVFRVLSEDSRLQVFGTVRRKEARCFFISELASRLIVLKNIECQDELDELFISLCPEIVINCIAERKPTTSDVIKSIKIQNPNSKIHILASNLNAKVLENIKYIDKVIIIESNINSLLEKLTLIRKTKYDFLK